MINTREKLIEVGLWDSSDLRDPAQEISAAWQVVEKLKDKKFGGRNSSDGFTLDYDGYHKKWHAEFGFTFEYADTAPLAICLAALKAVGVEIDKEEK